MARGTVVLDENLFHLTDGLKKLNIRVITPKARMSDAQIKHDLLANRILITNNSKDFIRDASAYDYGIIATEFLQNKDSAYVVNKIHEAFVDLSLWSKRHGFIVQLKDSGAPEYRELTN